MTKQKVLITGANGFLGRYLCENLSIGFDYDVYGSTRRSSSSSSGRYFEIGSIDGGTNWHFALEGKSIVIHCAALAHAKATDEEYQRVNVQGTQALAEQCVESGVKHLVFISSIGVNGTTTKGRPFTAEDAVDPSNAYAKSKADAEEVIRACLLDTGVAYTIIRPPLIYGRNAPGSFGTLLNMLNKGLPLPLANINNKRSFVSLDNLISLIQACLLNPKAYNQTFVVSDGEDISTTELIKLMMSASGKSAVLFPVPKKVIKFFASKFGKQGMYEGLFENLQIDMRDTCEQLSWRPPCKLQEGIAYCFNQEVS